MGDLHKPEVRRLAEEMKLPSAFRPDSQGICFLGKVNYNDFIRHYVGEKQGQIIEMETGKILGTHKGFWFHTIGQRKGLGLSGGPWFVVDKNTEENSIYVSNGYDPIAQYKTEIRLTDMQLLHPEFKLAEGMPIRFKIRHQPEFNSGQLAIESGNIVIQSSQAISGVAPGQFGVLYHAEQPYCLGSGVIV